MNFSDCVTCSNGTPSSSHSDGSSRRHWPALTAAWEEMAAAARSGDLYRQNDAHQRFHVEVVALAGQRHLRQAFEPVILKLQLHMAANLRLEAEHRNAAEGVDAAPPAARGRWHGRPGHRAPRPGRPRRSHLYRLALRLAALRGRNNRGLHRLPALSTIDERCRWESGEGAHVRSADRHREAVCVHVRSRTFRAADHRHAARLRRARRLRRDARQRRQQLQAVIPPLQAVLAATRERRDDGDPHPRGPPARPDRLPAGQAQPRRPVDADRRPRAQGPHPHPRRVRPRHHRRAGPAARRAGRRQAGQGLLLRHRPARDACQAAGITSLDRHRRDHRGLRAHHRPRGQRPRLRVPRALRLRRLLLPRVPAARPADDRRPGRHLRLGRALGRLPGTRLPSPAPTRPAAVPPPPYRTGATHDTTTTAPPPRRTPP